MPGIWKIAATVYMLIVQPGSDPKVTNDGFVVVDKKMSFGTKPECEAYLKTPEYAAKVKALEVWAAGNFDPGNGPKFDIPSKCFVDGPPLQEF